eukprot:1597863-Amphidinium_carterae.1
MAGTASSCTGPVLRGAMLRRLGRGRIGPVWGAAGPAEDVPGPAEDAIGPAAFLKVSPASVPVSDEDASTPASWRRVGGIVT